MLTKNVVISLIVILIVATTSFTMGIEKKEILPSKLITIGEAGDSFYTSYSKASGDTLLNESFEGTVEGWSYINNDADSYYWGIYVEDSSTDCAHSGTNGAGIHFNSSGNDDWFITPQIITTTGSTLTFSFWARSELSSYLEDFNVKLSTSGSDMIDFSVTLEEIRSASFDWTLYTYDLSNYAGESIYLAIQCVSVDEYYLWADDFLVTAEGTTSALAADFSADVTSGTAPLTVQFTDLSTGSPTSWDWDFNSDGSTDATLQNPSYTFTDAGSYYVSLSVSDGTNADGETKANYIVVTPESGAATITSTSIGGDWTNTTTWVGGVVPTATDNVVIAGPVIVNTATAVCNDININSGITLTKDNNGRTLYVHGNLINSGILTENNYGDFTINIDGNVTNNGIWEFTHIIFTGTNDNTIQMGTSNIITDSYISKSDPTSSIIMGSDTQFNNCHFTNDYYLSSVSTPFQINIPETTGYTFDLMKTSYLKSVIFNGNGNFLKDANLATDNISSTILENVNLTGVVSVAGDSVTFINNNVVVQDTLAKDNNGRTLYVKGDFLNNGVVSENNYGDFTINIDGNVTNNGIWEFTHIIFSGTSDNTIQMGASNIITDSYISKSDPASSVIIGSNAKFNNCHFTNNYYLFSISTPFQINIPETTGYTLDLMKTSYLKSVVFNGNGNFLKDANLANDYISSAVLENVNLTGVVSVAGDSVTFINNNVVVQDTLTKDNNGRTLFVQGDLLNNGVVTEDNYGDFFINISGNLFNNGTWETAWTVMDGFSNQIVENTNSYGGNLRFVSNVNNSSTYQWYKDATPISGATSEAYIKYTVTENDFGTYYCQTDVGNSRTISLIQIVSGLSADFSADSLGGFAPLTVQFTDLSTGATSWEWDLNGDNAPDATIQNPSYTYSSAGTYTVTLTISDGSNVDSVTKEDFIIVHDETTPGDTSHYNEFIITADDGIDFDYFGSGVAVDGSYAVIGAKGDDNLGSLSGSAYVYNWNGYTWVHQALLTASDAEANDYFGIKMDIDGDFIVIGVQNKNSSTGAAYIYHYDQGTWTEVQKLTASDAAEDDRFGTSVSLNGNYLIVGAEGDDNDNGSTAGAAYVFYNNGTSWVEQQKIIPSSLTAFDKFGHSVSLTDGYAAISAYQYDDGAVFLYKNNGSNVWTEHAILMADFPASFNNSFGYAIDMIPGKLAVTSYAGNGKAFIYSENMDVWTLEDSVVCESDSWTGYGWNIALSEEYLVLGAEEDDEGGNNTGAAYIYKFNGTNWNLDNKLIPESELTGIRFGSAVAMDNSKLLVGAIYADYNDGAAYVYTPEMEQAPFIAGFMATPLNGSAPLEVSFTDTSYGSTSWSWDFDGDGSWDATVQNPTHLYTETGNYTVSLRVSDGNDNITITKEAYISVGEALVLEDGWNSIESGTTEDLNDVLFLDENKGFVVGNNGLFLRTKDGGASWETLPTEIQNNLNALTFFDDQTGIIVGSSLSGAETPIYKTTDGGESWNPMVSNSYTNLYSVAFKNSTTVYAVGWSYNSWSQKTSKLLKSIDAGATWAEITHPLEGIDVGMEEIAFANENNGYVAAKSSSASRLMYTHDGGDNWSLNAFMEGLYSVYFVNDLVGFTGGGSYLYKTIDGGNSWSSSKPFGFYGVYDINFHDEDRGFGVGYNGVAGYTVDGGDTWTKSQSPATGYLNASDFISDSLVCVVGDGGILFLFKDELYVGLDNESMMVIDDFRLKQNYPNPFNPTSTIEFDIPEAAYVNLSVYNIAGQKITELVNEYMTPGRYHYTVSANTLSSGIYFYKLQTREFTDIKKMTILK